MSFPPIRILGACAVAGACMGGISAYTNKTDPVKTVLGFTVIGVVTPTVVHNICNVAERIFGSPEEWHTDKLLIMISPLFSLDQKV